MSRRDPFDLEESASHSFACDVFSEPEARSGAWNMAIDAALLERCQESGRCHLRLYRWSEPTLSLGYFQKDESEIPPHLSTLPRVRRLSGGGAILHHRELTYSCTVPPEHPLARNPVRLYDVMHAGIIKVLSEFGWNCRLRGAVTCELPDSPFLCFARGDARDVLFEQHKVVGSAQRRRKGAVLQHGSILLHRSDLAPELPGLVDLAGERQKWDPVAFQQQLAETLPLVLGRSDKVSSLSEDVRRRAAEMCRFA